HQVAEDEQVSTLLSSGADASQRLSAVFQVAALKGALVNPKRSKPLKKAEVGRIEHYCESLLSGEKPYQVAAREGQSDFETFVERLIEAVLSGGTALAL